jgi:predicted tellurium resistance membrane protein TerC
VLVAVAAVVVVVVRVVAAVVVAVVVVVVVVAVIVLTIMLLLQWLVPLTGTYDKEERFFVKQPLAPPSGGSLLPSKSGDEVGQERSHATMQCVVLVAIAASDVVFAMDSIPAILSITTDPFLVITSNCFAVLGLRSLFFVLAALQVLHPHAPSSCTHPPPPPLPPRPPPFLLTPLTPSRRLLCNSKCSVIYSRPSLSSSQW